MKAANSGFIPNIQYGPPNPPGVIPGRDSSNLSTTGCGLQSKTNKGTKGKKNTIQIFFLTESFSLQEKLGLCSWLLKGAREGHLTRLAESQGHSHGHFTCTASSVSSHSFPSQIPLLSVRVVVGGGVRVSTTAVQQKAHADL